MRLKVGQAAPDFEIQDTAGVRHSLAGYKGRNLLLSFYRYASCPLCNQRVNRLSNWLSTRREEDFDVLAVFESPGERIRQYVGQQEPLFPLIPDPERRLYQLYRVESSWLKYVLAAGPFLGSLLRGYRTGRADGDKALVPADFLIDKNGIIQTAFYGRHIGDHLPLKKIDRFLDQNNTLKQHVEGEETMKEIKIYTTSWCPYCKAAKRFFEQNNWNYEEIDIEKVGISRQDLLKVGKGMSVPQIVIDGKPIGGYDDLMRLYG